MVQKINIPDAKIVLGYWGIRGLGQPIRFLLVCAKVPFSEVRLGVLQDGTLLDENKEGADWSTVKAELDMPFPNLPYLIDKSGDQEIKLAQSNAILRYLARKFRFYGNSETERTEIDVLQEEAYDFRNAIVKTAYTLGEPYEQVFMDFRDNILPIYLNKFENYLGEKTNHHHFVGNSLSLVDFVLYELLWQMTYMVPGSISLTNHPLLYAFNQAFEKHPEIAAYRQSQHYIDRPINSPWASFC